MENKKNYQRELDKLIETLSAKRDKEQGGKPRLFLHSCCAPCSSYVLEYLRLYFQITVFYYNPNISAQQEYVKRVAEQKRLIASYNEKLPEHRIEVVEGDYEPQCFYDIAKGLENCPEGGERCFACYELRLRKTAEIAAKEGYDYFATTLTISPLKNALKLNGIGEKLSGEYGVKWLPSDFKKKNGYKRSIELSAEYDLYRQDYCGCAYSKAERERQKKDIAN
ncbi:MAG: epoxyqueuosine reductase QueH [Lachnospiraceae bacterium]|nr:epoxyqueuosine reductase QueH [Lachnospiraceae bacterium]